MESSLEEQIKKEASRFVKISEDREVYIISHFDTDGITSAAILIQALKKLDRTFYLKIVKSLRKEFIYTLPKNKIILFLDLASNSLNEIRDSNLKDVFIIDHHELSDSTDKIHIINPHLHNNEKISSSGLSYLFCKQISQENKEFAKLAVLGMIGDRLEKEISKLNWDILKDGEIKKKRGLLLYPSTRPINITLEYSSNPYIPGISGNSNGVRELLREARITPKEKKYKNLIDLTKEEMKRLITAISLRTNQKEEERLLGDIFLINFFNKLEDSRELSAKINACSRVGMSGDAIKFCMEIPEEKKIIESIHIRYKRELINGLKIATELGKNQNKGYVIINSKDKIKDTMIGTIISILSSSNLYKEGTIVIGLSYDNDKIKVSAREVGDNGRNLRELLLEVMKNFKGEVGGHHFAAGCIIDKKDEERFLKDLEKNLEVEIIKVTSSHR